MGEICSKYFSPGMANEYLNHMRASWADMFWRYTHQLQCFGLLLQAGINAGEIKPSNTAISGHTMSHKMLPQIETLTSPCSLKDSGFCKMCVSHAILLSNMSNKVDLL